MARALFPGHEPWISFDLSALATANLGSSLSQLTSLAETPTESLGYLR